MHAALFYLAFNLQGPIDLEVVFLTPGEDSDQDEDAQYVDEVTGYRLVLLFHSQIIEINTLAHFLSPTPRYASV